MQTHKDTLWQDGDQQEWLYFRAKHQPTPIMEFLPWPLKVPGLVFPDGSSQWTAGGGGGGVSFLAGPGISLTPGMGTLTIANTQMQSPWLGNVNAGNFGITNLASINGVPVGSLMQSPWVGNVNASNYGVTNLASINGLAIGNYLQTPWLSNINAAQFILGNIPEIDFVFGAYTGSLILNNVGFEITAQNRALYLTSLTAGIELLGQGIFLESGVASGPALEVGTSTNSLALVVMANSNVGLSLATPPAYRLDVNGDINISAGSVYRINGVPISFAGGAYVNDNPPASPATGDFWFDATGLKLYIRFSGTWVGI